MNTFKYDYFASYGENFSWLRGGGRLLKNSALRFVYWGRKIENANTPAFKFICKIMMAQGKKKNHLEIEFNKRIGRGLVLAHPYNITINPAAKIGNNVVLFKGVTIGSVRSGKRVGAPIIGDRVVICCNGFVCGGITIGDDVLIAAGAFVDFDVPSNSVVIGNPGKVIHKDNPCQDYIRTFS